MAGPNLTGEIKLRFWTLEEEYSGIMTLDWA